MALSGAARVFVRLRPRPRAPRAPTALARAFATYAQDPTKWQNDGDVRAYGELLRQRAEQPDEFLAAAARLRGRGDIPADLRASAGRAQASELSKRALELAQGLRVDQNAPWPVGPFGDALEASESALALYVELARDAPAADAVEAEAGVAQHRIAETAHAEVRRLLASLHLLEVRWLQPQVEKARAVSFAVRSDDKQAVQQSQAQLSAVGEEAVSEEELLRRSVSAAEAAARLCSEVKGNSAADEILGPLRAQLELMLVELLRDWSLACACEGQDVPAARAMLRALGLPGAARLSREAADQLSETAGAIWEHSVKRLQSAGSPEALEVSTALGGALAKFNMVRP